MRLPWLLVACLVLAGCTDDASPDEEPDLPDDDGTPGDDAEPSGDGTGSPGGENETSEENETARDPVTWEVEVRDNSFSPAELTIQVGDTVKWVRAGSAPHTVTADNDEFHSGDCPGTDCFTPATRQEFSWTSEAVAEVPYYCEVHGGPGGSGMSGTVTVVERLDDVPT